MAATSRKREGIQQDEVWIYCTLTDQRLEVIISVSLIHTLYSSLEYTLKFSESALSSPVFWQRLATADVPLLWVPKLSPCFSYNNSQLSV
jgi:hypothetical protein